MDLRQLDVDPGQIQPDRIVRSTHAYLKNIKQLEPKALLAHFLLHVAGFMHGGRIIQSKYIKPSNKLTPYQITAKQYDFSEAMSGLGSNRTSPQVLYRDLAEQVNKIDLNDDECEALCRECKRIYQVMSDIYDGLCVMHTHQPQQQNHMLVFVSIGLVVLTLALKLLFDMMGPMDEDPSSQSDIKHAM